MSRPKLLDLFCKAGGAGMGYHLAGFNVIGVDIEPQPRYPFGFHRLDAIKAIVTSGEHFDAVHASPPCQLYSNTQKIQGNDHPDYVSAVRNLLMELGKPFIIENVPGSPLREPIELCGAMFGLRTYRHRLFESNIPLSAPTHPDHLARTTKMGRPPRADEFMHVVGNFSGVAHARAAMGIDWMTRDELREAIPPAYTEHIGRQLIAHMAKAVA
jgi:DNA (cytosine-5)-methyltransferase 1